MSTVTTKFSVHENGFKFSNSFELNFPIKFPLPFGASIDLNKVVFGLCGGMCFSALDYYGQGELPPQTEEVKTIDRNLFIYLCERQLESLKTPTLLKVIEWTLMEDKAISFNIARYEIPKLHRLLDKGEPAVLALIRVQNLDDLTKNHQVLATGYEFDPGAKTHRFNLYDPNHPQEEVFISIDFSDSNSGMRIEQTTGEFLRGFFVIPYKTRKTLPRPVSPVSSFAAGSVSALPFSLCWPVDSRRVNQYFGENPDTYKPFGLPGHEGLDLFALSGANVYAAANGVVTMTGHPNGHAYGRHIRLKHNDGNKVFQTIYAHLSESFVQNGQKVTAGELIGLADNTGNSFGSHLHLTLKIDGARTPGYPAGIVDPLPYLNESICGSGPTIPAESGLVVYTSGEMNLRSGPNITFPVVALLPAGEPLSVLGEKQQEEIKIGVEGEWLNIKTSSGTTGHVAAWLVQTTTQAFPPSDLVIYPFDTVNLRSGPGNVFQVLATLTMGDPLTVLGDPDLAKSKLGKQGEWIQIQTVNGSRGFVAAWLVHLTGQTAPPTELIVFPTDILNVRARPSTDGNIITIVSPEDPLTVLGSKEEALGRVGKPGQWLNVQTPTKHVGFVAAWFVRLSDVGHLEASQNTEDLLVYPTAEMHISSQPSLNAPRIGSAHRNEPLRVVESDLSAAKEKIGKDNIWIHAQRENGTRGWLAAWLLSAKQS